MSTCQACGGTFTAQRPSAKFCGDACRQRAHRDRVAADTPPPTDGPLVDAVRAELADLRQLDNANGQLAVQLARGMERRASSGLSRELREVLAHARFKAAQQGR